MKNTDEFGVTWPNTPADTNVTVSCPGGAGKPECPTIQKFGDIKFLVVLFNNDFVILHCIDYFCVMLIHQFAKNFAKVLYHRVHTNYTSITKLDNASRICNSAGTWQTPVVTKCRSYVIPSQVITSWHTVL